MRVAGDKTLMCNKLCNCLFSDVLTKRPALDATSFGLVTLDRQGVADQFSQQFRRFCTRRCHCAREKVRR